jgi:Holliday junction resolvasome RuvABC DNA-binding subunit
MAHKSKHEVEFHSHCIAAATTIRQNYGEAVRAQIQALSDLGYTSKEILPVLDEVLVIAQKLCTIQL